MDLTASDTKFIERFSMPNRWTFEMAPVKDLLHEVLGGADVVVDPFSGRSVVGTHRNDIVGGMDAEEWLDSVDVVADAFLMDPPYSPAQIKRSYSEAGIPTSMSSTQNARMMKVVRDHCHRLLRPGGVAVSFGWNSQGMLSFGYKRTHLMLVRHGGAHNDTIVCVDVKHSRPEPEVRLNLQEWSNEE